MSPGGSMIRWLKATAALEIAIAWALALGVSWIAYMALGALFGIEGPTW